MQFTAQGRFSSTWAIIVGSLLAIPVLVYGFVNFQSVLTRAGGARPETVQATAVTTTAAEISWTTGETTQGVVEFGTAPDQIIKYAPETTATTAHKVPLTLLEPGTTYYFAIRIGTERFDNNGVPWTFRTRSADQEQQERGTTRPLEKEKSVESGSESGSVQGVATTCPATRDCEAIKSLLGKGCTATEYVRCLNAR